MRSILILSFIVLFSSTADCFEIFVHDGCFQDVLSSMEREKTMVSHATGTITEDSSSHLEKGLLFSSAADSSVKFFLPFEGRYEVQIIDRGKLFFRISPPYNLPECYGDDEWGLIEAQNEEEKKTLKRFYKLFKEVEKKH